MIVNLFEPPPEKRTGGLESAIRSLEAFLQGACIDVRSNPSFEKLGEVRKSGDRPLPRPLGAKLSKNVGSL